MLIEALSKHTDALVALAPELKRGLGLLDDTVNLTTIQALVLASAVLQLKPDLVIDLGTGRGNSAFTFGLACQGKAKVSTFDLAPNWEIALSEKLAPFRAKLDGCVTPVIGDLLSYDFAPLVESAESVVVFWDAHGYDVAEHVLAHLMPLISDKRHVVICHDVTDKKWLTSEHKSYAGKRIWRGMEDFYRKPKETAFGIVGWSITVVDQIIPISEFCWRNDIEFHSLDDELHWKTPSDARSNLLKRMDLPVTASIHMGYFSMNETKVRHFPSGPALHGGAGE